MNLKCYSSWTRMVSSVTILFCLPFIIHAQTLTEITLNGSFRDAFIQDVFQDIESKSALKFFYKTEDLPKQKIVLRYEDKNVEEILDQVLKNSGLGFLLYRNNQVVIMNRQVVDQVYTVNYYQALEKSRTEEKTPPRQSTSINIGKVKDMSPSGRALLSGTIENETDGDPIIGATITWTGLEGGTATDENGQFSFDLPVGNYEMIIQYVGFDDLIEKINIYKNGDIKLKMTSATINLDEITVTAQGADASVENVQIGVTSLDMKNIKKIPAFLGEADVVKNLLLNPGVSSLGEGATGFNVRGGDVDQNLILQDEGFIFNASHALGFFSTFNADLISTVDLYKGNIPASYGGRLASAMDVQMRNGDFERFRLKGGIGPVSSRISFEGPIVKDKVSFVAGLRSSYSDWILKQIKVLEVSRSSAFFYDANLRLTIKPNERSSIILTGYGSDDEFIYNEEFGFNYNTLMAQLIYKQIFSDKMFNKFSIAGSKYESGQTDLDGVDASLVANGVSYLRLKEHLTYAPNNNFKLAAGLSSVFYEVDPGKQTPFGEESEVITDEIEKEHGLESALFANVEAAISPAFIISAGVRGVYYQYLGAQTVYEYKNSDFPNSSTITGTIEYGSGELIASYFHLEPRASMRYRFSDVTSIKLGYSRTSQFINQIFNTDSPTPSSQWQLSTNYLKPQKSHNTSIGYFRNFEDNLWETSIEAYYRHIDQLYDYRDFADLIVNDHLETEMLQGIGRTYGAELSIKKKKGEMNGWLSYTYSKSERQIEGINENEWYPSNFDKTHDVSFILNYQPNRRNTVTLNFSYSTGRPTTPPVGNYRTSNGLIVPIYSERNQFRIPDYHRLDIAYTLGKGYKRDKKIQTSWTISLYNVYSRRNAFSVFFTQAAFRQAQANKLAVLGSIIPSVTFNLEII